MSTKFTPHRKMNPESPLGQGFYGSTLGKITTGVVDNMRKDLLKLIEKQVGKYDSSIYGIGDYGSADGSASMDLIRDVIALVRERSGARRPVQVLYEDLHSNDFNSLFRRLHGEIPDPPSYLPQFPDVFTMATATNFYQQCAPDNSMDFVFSNVANHWLSQSLTNLKNCLFPCVVASEEERTKAGLLAAQDWETFLLHRAKELKPGGIVVVNFLGQHPDDTSAGYINTAHDFCVSLEHVWREFRDEGRISQAEFHNAVASEFYRRPEEVRAPFLSPDSPVRRAGLDLSDLQLVTSPCPFKAEWRRLLEETGVDTRRQAIAKMTARNRVWSSNIITNGLDPERKDKEEVLDALYQAVEERLQELPFESVRNGHVVIRAVVTKEPSL